MFMYMDVYMHMHMYMPYKEDRRPVSRHLESEGEMIRLETLIEHKLINSSFSSLPFLLKSDNQFPVEQVEATVSQSTESSPPPRPASRHLEPLEATIVDICPISLLTLSLLTLLDSNFPGNSLWT